MEYRTSLDLSIALWILYQEQQKLIAWIFGMYSIPVKRSKAKKFNKLIHIKNFKKQIWIWQDFVCTLQYFNFRISLTSFNFIYSLGNSYDILYTLYQIKLCWYDIFCAGIVTLIVFLRSTTYKFSDWFSLQLQFLFEERTSGDWGTNSIILFNCSI